MAIDTKPIRVKPIVIPQTEAVSAALTAAVKLPSFMERQSQDNWCWAACGASVGNLFHGSGKYTQCGIACKCLNDNTCCVTPGNCNKYGFLDLALQNADSFDFMNTGPASLTTVKSQINAQQPVGVRVAWTATTAHFLMITGYEDQKITLQDPWYGESSINFGSFASNYQSGGTWTHTYFTKK